MFAGIHVASDVLLLAQGLHLKASCKDCRRDAPVNTKTPTDQRGGRSNGDTGRMGFDPQRRHRRRPSDVVYVAAALVVGALLVLWALVG